MKQDVLLPDDIEEIPGEGDLPECLRDMLGIMRVLQIVPFHIVVELPQTGKVKRTLENIQIVVIDFQVFD